MKRVIACMLMLALCLTVFAACDNAAPANPLADAKAYVYNTPALEEGSILPGVTRASCIELLKSWGYTVTERRVSVEELYAAHRAGKLDEAFGTGTAAVISPIGELNDNGDKIVINDGKIGAIAQKLYDNLTGIQWGRLPDTMGWTVKVTK